MLTYIRGSEEGVRNEFISMRRYHLAFIVTKIDENICHHGRGGDGGRRVEEGGPEFHLHLHQKLRLSCLQMSLKDLIHKLLYST